MLVDSIDTKITTPQLVRDSWTDQIHVVTFAGCCEYCKAKTYSTSGTSDPRGFLDQHTNSSFFAKDYEKQGRNIVACFECANDYKAYKQLMKIASKVWKDLPIQQSFFKGGVA